MKHCKKCDTVKDESDFNKNKTKSSGLSTYCRDCTKLESKEWRQKNPERAKEARRKWAKLNPEKIKEFDKRKYLKRIYPRTEIKTRTAIKEKVEKNTLSEKELKIKLSDAIKRKNKRLYAYAIYMSRTYG